MQIARNDADMSVDLYMMYHKQSSMVDFSHGISRSTFRWVSRPPQPLPLATNLLRIYSTDCWVLILLSISSVALFIGWASIVVYPGLVSLVKEDILLLPLR